MKTKTFSDGALFFWVIWLLIGLTIGGVMVEFTVEYWLSLSTGRPVDVPYLACALVAIPCGGGLIFIAGITWLASYGIDNPHYIDT